MYKELLIFRSISLSLLFYILAAPSLDIIFVLYAITMLEMENILAIFVYIKNSRRFCFVAILPDRFFGVILFLLHSNTSLKNANMLRTTLGSI